MRRFWVVLYTITTATQIPFAVALAWLLDLRGVPRPSLLALILVGAIVAQLRGRIAQARWDSDISRSRLLLVEEPFYVHWCAAVASTPLFLLGVIASLVWRILHTTRPDTVSLGAIAAGAYVAGLALSFYGVVVRRRWVRVRTIDVPIAGLGPALDGYRIAQLSDLHIGGLWPKARAARWVRRVNALDVDLVALTGDYVTSGTAFHADIASVLSAMRARDGVTAVMGNHDYFGDGEPLITLLRERGVAVLRNEHTTFARGSDGFTLAGIDDTWTRRADIPRALAGRDIVLPLVVLAHDPQLFPELARQGAGLVLSGHTHWGQIALPFFAVRVNLSCLSYRYHAGLYRIEASTLYVNPGLGTTGPPVRLGAPPEITVLRLRCSASRQEP